MSLGQAFRKLVDAGLLTLLAPRPLPQFLSPSFRVDLHCLNHQGPGHETDRCTALRHSIQDLIDQSLVNLGQPSVTTNPFPAHSTHAVPPPAGGIQFIDFDGTDDFIRMMSWDDHAPEPIMLVEDSEVDGFVLSTVTPPTRHPKWMSSEGATLRDCDCLTFSFFITDTCTSFLNHMHHFYTNKILFTYTLYIPP